MCTLYERIQYLCDEKGITGARMCSDLGLSKSTVTDLKSGRKKGVTAATALKIATYFGVTVAYLMGEEEQKETPASETNPRDERRKQFIKLYDQLTPESEEAAFVLLQQLRELQEKKLDSRP